MTWIQTYTGRRFYADQNTGFNWLDIAHSLANICRFNGHTKKFYSVAQHSVEVALYARNFGADVHDQLWALIHDASEAYLGDQCRPFKHLAPELRDIHHRVTKEICQSLGLSVNEPQIVKDGDLALLATERRDLLVNTGERWECLDNAIPLTRRLKPWSPKKAKRKFLEALTALRSEARQSPDVAAHDLAIAREEIGRIKARFKSTAERWKNVLDRRVEERDALAAANRDLSAKLKEQSAASADEITRLNVALNEANQRTNAQKRLVESAGFQFFRKYFPGYFTRDFSEEQRAFIRTIWAGPIGTPIRSSLARGCGTTTIMLAAAIQIVVDTGKSVVIVTNYPREIHFAIQGMLQGAVGLAADFPDCPTIGIYPDRNCRGCGAIHLIRPEWPAYLVTPNGDRIDCAVLDDSYSLENGPVS